MLSSSRVVENMSQSDNLKKHGFAVLPNLFNPEQIAYARKTVLDNMHLLKNTRPTVSSRHLAGFHRHPQFENLHAMLASNPGVCAFIRGALDDMEIVTIGLSDITINRSQEWHCDLLRGRFSTYLNDDVCWGPRGGGVYKALLYLQPGRTLATVPGSHLRRTSLEDDQCVIPKVTFPSFFVFQGTRFMLPVFLAEMPANLVRIALAICNLASSVIASGYRTPRYIQKPSPSWLPLFRSVHHIHARS